MIEFVNIEKFIEFIEKNLKNDTYDLQSFKDDLLTHWSNNGCTDFDEETNIAHGHSSYELSHHMTKSGNPELIAFDVEEIYKEEEIEKTFIIF